MATINTLPPKVMGEIFQLCQDDLTRQIATLTSSMKHHSGLSRFPVVFTAVCKDWRVVAESCPCLWSTLTVLVSIDSPGDMERIREARQYTTRPQSPVRGKRIWAVENEQSMDVYPYRSGYQETEEYFPPIDIVKKWLTLGRDAPLSFCIRPWIGPGADLHESDLSHYSSRVAHVFELFTTLHLRWQTAWLHFTSEATLPEVLARSDFPLLRDVSLNVVGGIVDDSPEAVHLAHDKFPQHITMFLTRSPNLTSFYFAYDAEKRLPRSVESDILKVGIRWKRMTKITVVGQDGVEWPVLLKLLVECNLLTSLLVQVRDIRATDHPADGGETLKFLRRDQLKELHFSPTSCILGVAKLIDHLVLPNLHACSLPPKATLPSLVDPFVDLVERSLCGLRRLYIHSQARPDDSVSDVDSIMSIFLAVSPTLEVLHLHIVSIDYLMAYLTIKPPGQKRPRPPLCPRLRRIHISFCETASSDRALFATMVESRWEPVVGAEVVSLEEFDATLFLGPAEWFDDRAVRTDVERLRALAARCAFPRTIRFKTMQVPSKCEGRVTSSFVDSARVSVYG